MSEEILMAVKMPEITMQMAVIIAAGINAVGAFAASALKARKESATSTNASTSEKNTNGSAGWAKMATIMLIIFDGVVALGSLVLLAMLMRSGVPLTTGGAAVIAGLCSFFIVSSLRRR